MTTSQEEKKIERVTESNKDSMRSLNSNSVITNRYESFIGEVKKVEDPFVARTLELFTKKRTVSQMLEIHIGAVCQM